MAEKVVLGLSGGMDSAYAALKLKEAGYEVIGVNIVMKDSCDCSVKAGMLAKHLGLDYYVIDAKGSFEKHVICPFANAYVNGLTPNPCVLCNPNVKIKQLFDVAERLGAERVATGHYSVPVNHNGRYTFARAVDTHKDQGYFLYGLSQKMISKLLMPLGNTLKADIKSYFKNDAEFSMVDGSESTDICFVEKGKYADVVAEYMPLPPKGNFIDASGKVLGKHNGIHNYTIGQRKGLGIALGAPAYVSAINSADNTVTLSFGDNLAAESFKVANINLLACGEVEQGMRFLVRTRYRAKPIECIISNKNDDNISVSFCNERCIAAPGQSAVFYDENGYIAFGGIIIR